MPDPPGCVSALRRARATSLAAWLPAQQSAGECLQTASCERRALRGESDALRRYDCCRPDQERVEADHSKRTYVGRAPCCSVAGMGSVCANLARQLQSQHDRDSPGRQNGRCRPRHGGAGPRWQVLQASNEGRRPRGCRRGESAFLGIARRDLPQAPCSWRNACPTEVLRACAAQGNGARQGRHGFQRRGACQGGHSRPPFRNCMLLYPARSRWRFLSSS
jgi:hypothetical protein